jgi:hypothetical protein
MHVAVLLLFVSLMHAQYGPPRTLGSVSIDGLVESSGIAASHAHPGLFWSHNDGEGGPYLFAFDAAGNSRGRVRVTGAKMYDWEDMAIGPGNQIYIGDIGDNNRKRKQIVVYQVPEPDPHAAATKPAKAITLRYPDGPHDAEALIVHPRTGDIYIVTKARGRDTKTSVYKAPSRPKSPVLLKHVADVDLPNDSMIMLVLGRVTGGAVSPDGTRVVLCDYFRAYEAKVPGGRFDGVWKQKWLPIDIGKRTQGEGITYRHDGNALVATSEGDTFPLIEVERRE